MAVNRIENTNFDETTLTQDGVGGGGGTSIDNQGGTGSSNSNGTTSTTQTSTLTNLFVFNISSNESSFTTLLNGESVGNDKRIRITRDDLSKGIKRIDVTKNGYSNNEYYTIEMVDDDIPIIDNPNIEQPLGISTKDIVLTKYTKKPNRVVGTPISIRNEISSDLSFTFNKLRGGDEYEEPISYTTSFNISGKGNPVSVLKNGNKSAEFFPATGATEFKDVEGTKYTIRSSDLSLYKITNLLYTSNNKEEELSANVGESLQVDITLTSDFLIDIITEEVKQPQPALNPQIELVNTNTTTYNINSKAGVPLMFKKNKDVKAITVIIGDDVLEFDDLDSGDLCGVTIPHSSFKKIGKYNIKAFPFSFDDYENQVRPVEKGDTIETKKVIPKFDVTEEVKLPPIDLSNRFNPYVPVSSGGSGGGGRPLSIDLVDESLNETEINPFTNDGSFVNRRLDNRNIR